jgi:hypothetical protein
MGLRPGTDCTRGRSLSCSAFPGKAWERGQLHRTGRRPMLRYQSDEIELPFITCKPKPIIEIALSVMCTIQHAQMRCVQR